MVQKITTTKNTETFKLKKKKKNVNHKGLDQLEVNYFLNLFSNKLHTDLCNKHSIFCIV